MDDKFFETLVQYIQMGNYAKTACAAMGVNEHAYYKWLREGSMVVEYFADREDADEVRDDLLRDYKSVQIGNFSPLQHRSAQFYLEIEKASAQAEAYAVGMIRKAMPEQWQAAMTFLERRYPGKWRRRDQIDIGEAQVGGIDESMLLNDPRAIALVHDALEQVGGGTPREKSPAPLELSPNDIVEVDGDVQDAGAEGEAGDGASFD